MMEQDARCEHRAPTRFCVVCGWELHDTPPVVDNPDGQGHGETDDQRRHREAIDAAVKGAIGL